LPYRENLHIKLQNQPYTEKDILFGERARVETIQGTK